MSLIKVFLLDSLTLLDKEEVEDCTSNESTDAGGLDPAFSWNAPVATALDIHSRMKSLLASKAVTEMPISSKSLRIVFHVSSSSGSRSSTVCREMTDGARLPCWISHMNLSSFCSTLD